MNKKDRFDPAVYKDKPGCVLGLGRSGLAVANLLAGKGFQVLVSDSRPRAKLDVELKRLHYHAQVEAGGHGARVYKSAYIVKSPGIPSHAPVLVEARKRGIPVFSELEIALAFAPTQRIYAVTGTNGKTTTTKLLGEILAASGARVHVAGNIGTALSEKVADITVGDALVLEVSSYQLEDSRWFKPKAATLLNITPDHAEHHGSHDLYVEAKARVFLSQDKNDVTVFNAADPQVMLLSERGKARKLTFARSKTLMPNAWREKGRLYFKLGAKTLTLTPPKLPGEHNLENAMAAALMALGTGVPAEAVQKAFDTFTGVEHRLEPVSTVKGVSVINDSKATNVDSTLVALQAFPAKRNILLILGGLDKGAPYEPLRAEIKKRVKTILTIGSAAGKIARELKGAAPITACETIDKAVEAGLAKGRKGDVLLLSPACASFDQFKDFEDRGRQFKGIVYRYEQERDKAAH